jgi:RND family efflux transporter MFP subunit
MRFDRDKNLARLEKIQKDRAGMTLKAPIDGIVYHGKFHKGQWTGYDGKLIPNGTVNQDDVFMTVVKPSPVVVHLTVDEKDVYVVKPGLKGQAKVPFHPQLKLGTKVTNVMQVPAAPGKFDAQVALQMPDGADLRPGMAVNVKFVPYSKKDAIAIPTSAIQEEDDKSFVHVVDKKGKQHKREVTTGQTDGDNTEILSGLREGEEVLLERPGEKKSTPTPPEKEKGPTP